MSQFNLDKIVKKILHGDTDSRSPSQRRSDFFKETLKGKELKKVKGEWVPLDGAIFVGSELGETHEYGGEDAYGQNVPVGREKQVGTFDANGGSIVYVDGDGREWMAPFNVETQKALVEAGYTSGSIAVPHMYDKMTRFKDEELHKKWLELSKKAGIEGKDFPLLSKPNGIL